MMAAEPVLHNSNKIDLGHDLIFTLIITSLLNFSLHTHTGHEKNLFGELESSTFFHLNRVLGQCKTLKSVLYTPQHPCQSTLIVVVEATSAA